MSHSVGFENYVTAALPLSRGAHNTPAADAQSTDQNSKLLCGPRKVTVGRFPRTIKCRFGRIFFFLRAVYVDCTAFYLVSDSFPCEALVRCETRPRSLESVRRRAC